jgi:anti-sigma regulatory factor (Ser/Thr protein kinase)
MSTKEFFMKGEGIALLVHQVDLLTAPTLLSTLHIALDEFWLQVYQLSGNSTALPEPEVQYAILAATMEIAENIIRYAYLNSSPENWLSMKISLFVDSVEVVLSDGGRSFDPPSDDRDLSFLWDQTEQGGWGLILARQAVDHLSYAREEGVNVWKMVTSINR